MKCAIHSLTASALFLAGIASADLVVPGADGSDGIFNPTEDVVIDLSLAATGNWDDPSPVEGNGVYDPEKWAIIFKYSEVDIPAGVTVRFENHPANPPVVWLVSGGVEISGILNLDGEQGHLGTESQRFANGGPGGFRGGYATNTDGGPSATGMGPGGGPFSNRSGSYGTAFHQDLEDRVYGNSSILPLIGGSGGSGASSNNHRPHGAGGGGGAILIATTDSFQLNGTISARGGRSGVPNINNANMFPGSGGAIRVISPSISGNGTLQADAPNAAGLGGGIRRGGDGRIRLESNRIDLTSIGSPRYSRALPGAVARLWPAEDVPTLTPVSIGGQTIPADPNSKFEFPNADVLLNEAGEATLLLESRNLPDTATVTVRMVPEEGPDQVVIADFVSENGDGVSTWEAQLDLQGGFAAIQARAVVD